MRRGRSLRVLITLFGVASSLPSGIVVHAQSAGLPSGNVVQRSRSGPVAIAMQGSNQAVVLGNDGRLTLFDVASRRRGAEVFRVPSDFAALDAGTGTLQGSGVVCLTLYRRTASAYRGFLLQLIGRREVWRAMPRQGVYVGVAVDSGGSYAYTSNSTDNQIYRVGLGSENGPVSSVTHVVDADRLGPLALDSVGQRLFAADIESGSIYTVSLPSGVTTKLVTLKEVQEVRALAWHSTARRLLIADSAREAVWVVDPDHPDSSRKIKHGAVRDPAGLVVAEGGEVWLADESARTLFELKLDQPEPVVLSVPW